MFAFNVCNKILLTVALCGIWQNRVGAQTALLGSAAPNSNISEQQNIPMVAQIGSLPGAQEVLSSSYALGPGDHLLVEVANVSEYTREYEILADGTLNLPLIGAVSIQGLTLSQAANEIERQYQRYIHTPVISLDLLAARPVQIAIAGEINRPGTYIVPAAQGIPTVTQAVQLAGGITQMADVRNIQIYRSQKSGLQSGSPTGVNLWNLLLSGDLTQDVSLRDGDTLFIPVATTLDNSEITMLAEASFSPETITVNVVGEVASPGAIQVQPNIPLNQALLAAGGFNSRASTGTVDLVRLNPNGTVEQHTIEVDFAKNVDEESNPALRDNDTVVVSRSESAEFTDTVTPYVGPLGSVLRLIDLIF
ncbi:MAG: polysaccharide transporter [Leptolyngbya sp. SIO3F4]|nr:polysaccharide transporter [Leptolyngbya sp. SIO3F4]